MEPKRTPVEGRAEKKKKQMCRRIIDVAVELFERQGFNETTMEQIAEEADIARKTLYNHFSSKEAIADAYVRGVSNRLARENLTGLQDLPNTKMRLLAVLNKAYQWVEYNPEITKVVLGYRLKSLYQKSGEYSDNQTGTQNIVADIIRQGQRYGEIRQDIPVRLLVVQIDVFRSSVVFDWVNDTTRFELREEIAKMVDLFLYGAAAREKSRD